MIIMMLVLIFSAVASAEGEDALGEIEGHHPAHAVLFAPLVLTIGIGIYYVLSRYLHWLPYTAIMFLIGLIMGLVASSEALVLSGTEDAYVLDTLTMWQSIDSEVLLLVFLPGLIFKDALGQNPYLFAMGFLQLFIFAFPNVLAGTFLTALVGFHVLPYQWPWFLCMTFGAIMSATDPVAVSALLEEVGAPPRLTTHIAGESLLNDGAAIVFCFIFKDLYLYGIGIEGVGEDIDFGKGVVLFLQKAFGGCAIGCVAGGAIILVLSLLNRRFSREENIVQVTAVLGMVYLNYFVAEIVCHTSGVIATLTAGLVVKFFGRGSINCVHLMDDFFSITEHILNTVLFCLGGLVWGFTLYENHRNGLHDGSDWGYLILLYILLHVIRVILFVAVYPITSRIGLKTNWKETTFQIYGGLRGAVGIALAIFLNSEIAEFVIFGGHDMTTEQEDAAQVYFMVGGMAFLTLFLNGATAGPLLKRLGLADSTETRQRIVAAEAVCLRGVMLETCVKFLTRQRFKNVDFAFVQRHIQAFQDLNMKQVLEAVRGVKETTDQNSYTPPHLQSVLAVLGQKEDLSTEEVELLNETPTMRKRKPRKVHRMSSVSRMIDGEPMSAKEMRLLFISILRSSYECLIDEGIIRSQDGQTIGLIQSLELAKTEVNDGGKLNDLQYVNGFSDFSVKYSNYAEKIMCLFGKCRPSIKHRDILISIRFDFAFIHAHERAQKIFQQEFGDVSRDLSEGGKTVLWESVKQVEKVREKLNSEEIRKVVSECATRRFCHIILTKGIEHIEKLVRHGLLKESEAEHITEDLVRQQKAVLHATGSDDATDPVIMESTFDYVMEEAREMPILAE